MDRFVLRAAATGRRAAGSRSPARPSPAPRPRRRWCPSCAACVRSSATHVAFSASNTRNRSARRSGLTLARGGGGEASDSPGRRGKALRCLQTFRDCASRALQAFERRVDAQFPALGGGDVGCIPRAQGGRQRLERVLPERGLDVVTHGASFAIVEAGYNSQVFGAGLFHACKIRPATAINKRSILTSFIRKTHP